MSDKFIPASMKELSSWVFSELEKKQSIFGIPQELFYKPNDKNKLKVKIYDKELETPLGVAAGPHTQMAQNIIVSWLCGARFIELKTVQTLDEIEVSKPCIDMLDAGYNVEWSQELKIEQSFDEYIKAWILIYALHNKLGFAGDAPGMIFNISVGYNMEGVLKPNVQWFLDSMLDAGVVKDEYVEILADFYPEIKNIEIPYRLSDNVTLSTMHGCPPDEIGKIASYLIEERGFHTSVKCNPTLLGPDMLRDILNKELGFRDISVPDIAFEHDLKYADAVPMLNMLQEKADKKGVVFGVKLSNTLEVENHRNIFNKNEKMMYMSGRPLHALTVNLAKILGEEFEGKLLMSYAGGADCYNIADLIRSGMKTVTVCSDILRPGGYARILQYIEHLDIAFNQFKAKNIENYIKLTAEKLSENKEIDSMQDDALLNLNQYADFVYNDPLLNRDTFERKNTKTDRELTFFDCIKAPCLEKCPIDQNVPVYVNKIKNKSPEDAAEVIKKDNPIPVILGRACNHACESVCTRTHYDEPIAIRELKRYALDINLRKAFSNNIEMKNIKVAVIGAGPAGLSAAKFLRENGIKSTIFEERSISAGMVSKTIPNYRATDSSIERDIEEILKLGVEIKYNCKVGKDITLNEIREKYNYTVVAVGAQKGAPLGIDGENSEGVIDGIEFLKIVKEGNAPELGAEIGVIGAGDVAMDCARVANRLTGGKVSIVYRRSIEQMPAHKEELDGAIEEGIEIKELSSPKSIVSQDGRLLSLKCGKMKLGEPDSSGRKRPIEIPNSDIEIKLDNLIIAIGQKPDFDFIENMQVKLNSKGYIKVNNETMETSLSGVFAAGDAIEDGPLSIVKACGDGKKIATAILCREGIDDENEKLHENESTTNLELIKKRAKRQFRVEIPELEIEERHDFDEIVQTLSKETAEIEAGRCLKCDLMCSTCVSVCPNKAMFAYNVQSLKIALPILNIKPGKTEQVGEELFNIEQKTQTAVFTGFCNECANCAIFCPTSGDPYKNKPRFYNDLKEFNEQSDNAFMISKNEDGYLMKAKFEGEEHCLVLSENIVYSKSGLEVQFAGELTEIKDLIAANMNVDEFSLKECAVMYVLLKSILASKSEMPLN